jgi:transposase
MNRTSTTYDLKELRRRRALELDRAGWLQADIAAALGVSNGAVSKWLAAARRGGPDALRARPIPGRPPRLSDQQKQRLPELLWEGAEAHGFRGEVWTCARVAKAIERTSGVRYHKDHVGRLLKGLGWTPQVPAVRAVQRDEEAIERWRVEVWPERKKRPGRSGGRCCSWTSRASTCCRAGSRPTALAG